MPSQNKTIETFLSTLTSLKILSAEEIEAALDPLGGLDEAISDQLYISIYEQIGFQIGAKLSYAATENFIRANNSFLAEDAENRYFFIWAALQEMATLSGLDSARKLISVCPEDYQKLLWDNL